MKRNLRLEILRLLLKTDHHMYLSEFARLLSVPSSHVLYHLRKMVEEGILIRVEKNGEIRYRAEALFHKDNRRRLEKFVEKFTGEMENPSIYGLINCLEMIFLELPSDS